MIINTSPQNGIGIKQEPLPVAGFFVYRHLGIASLILTLLK